MERDGDESAGAAVAFALTAEEAGVLSWAIEYSVEFARDLAGRLAADSRHRQAGFNQYDRVKLLEGVLQRLDESFPEEPDEDDADWSDADDE